MCNLRNHKLDRMRRIWHATKMNESDIRISKKCIKCNETKPIQFFYNKNPKFCRKCCNDIKRIEKGWTSRLEKEENNFQWSLELCKLEALKHTSKTGWRNSSSASYTKAQRNGWLKECTSHMPERCHAWTEDDCKQLLIHYGSPRGWAKKHYRAYKKAESLGLFKDYDYQNGRTKSKPVINRSTGETFKSVKAAAKSISVPAGTLHSAIIRKTICAGSLWEFVN